MKYLALDKTRLDGRYDVHTHLGCGSYSEIFVAKDSSVAPESPHSQVVIKALNVFLQNDLDVELERTLVENFQNEAIALDRVRHPNILSRLGHGTAKDLNGTIFHYLVLEYLSGGDLAKACRGSKLSLEKALFYLEQVCAGLSFAHENQIIHRDIKPQNLLLTADTLTVKIADFGVARISQTDSPITRVGTNIYAPPEHSPMLAGQTGLLVSPKLTPAADIYSLAKTVYALITGESPRYFANQTITELPVEIRKEIWAESLLTTLKRATIADSRLRHQSVNEFWREISTLTSSRNSEKETFVFEQSTSSLYSIPKPQSIEDISVSIPKPPEFRNSEKLGRLPGVANGLNAVSVISESLLQTQESNSNAGASQNGTFKEKNLVEPVRLPKKRRRRFARTAALFSGLLLLFAGALFATQYFISSQNIFTGFSGSLSSPNGISTTDINLRSNPNSAENNRIGVVSKNSRVRILDEKDSWYQIEVIEHGRPPVNNSNAEKGWVFGKFVKVDDN